MRSGPRDPDTEPSLSATSTRTDSGAGRRKKHCAEFKAKGTRKPFAAKGIHDVDCPLATAKEAPGGGAARARNFGGCAAASRDSAAWTAPINRRRRSKWKYRSPVDKYSEGMYRTTGTPPQIIVQSYFE